MIEQVLERLRDVLVANYITEQARMLVITAPASVPTLAADGVVLPSAITETNVKLEDIDLDNIHTFPSWWFSDVGEEELERDAGSGQRLVVKHTLTCHVVTLPQPDSMQARRVLARMMAATKLALVRYGPTGGAVADTGQLADVRIPSAAVSDDLALDEARFDRIGTLIVEATELQKILNPSF